MFYEEQEPRPIRIGLQCNRLEKGQRLLNEFCKENFEDVETYIHGRRAEFKDYIISLANINDLTIHAHAFDQIIVPDDEELDKRVWMSLTHYNCVPEEYWVIKLEE